MYHFDSIIQAKVYGQKYKSTLGKNQKVYIYRRDSGFFVSKNKILDTSFELIQII